MKKKDVLYIMLILVLAVVSAFAGFKYGGRHCNICGREIFFWEDNLHEDLGAYVLNGLDQKEISNQFGHIEEVKLQGEEKIVVVGGSEPTHVQIWKVKYEDGMFSEEEMVFEKKDLEKNSGILLHAYRSEGAPSYKIKVIKTRENGRKFESNHYISYNGNFGNPSVEYMMLKEVE